MYAIVNKIEYLDGIITTQVGYINDNQQLCDDINNLYYQNYENWININKNDLENNVISIGDFFINIPYTYSAYQQTDNIDGMGLTEIININEL